MLLLPPASVLSPCSGAAGCVLQLYNRRWPAGTTPAALPGHPTSCTQTSSSPASGRQRRGDGRTQRTEKHRQKLRHDLRTEKTGEECRRSKVGKSGKDERGKGVIRRRRESEREKSE